MAVGKENVNLMGNPQNIDR